LGGVACPGFEAREELEAEGLVFLFIFGGLRLLDCGGLHEEELFGRGVCGGRGRDGGTASAVVAVVIGGGGGRGVVVVDVESGHACSEGRARTRSGAAGVGARWRRGKGGAGRRGGGGAHGRGSVGGWWSGGLLLLLLLLLARCGDATTTVAAAAATAVEKAVQVVTAGRGRSLAGGLG